jgi:hypothetical protein
LEILNLPTSLYSDNTQPESVAVALELARAGLRVHPLAYPLAPGVCSCYRGRECSHPGKHPAMKGWQERASTDPAAVREMFAGQQFNVGIVPGNGIVAVDIDNEPALSWFHERNGGQPITPTINSHRGPKFLFVSNNSAGCVPRISNGENEFAFEILGENQNIAAWGMHPKGSRYRWRFAPIGADIPSDFGPAPFAPLPAFIESLRVSRATEKREAAVVVPAPAGIVEDRRTEARAIAYLRVAAPAVSGQGGSRQTLSVARFICWGLALGAQRGFELLRDVYNLRCVPAWAETDLYRKCTEAMKPEAAPYPFGSKIGEPAPVFTVDLAGLGDWPEARV